MFRVVQPLKRSIYAGLNASGRVVQPLKHSIYAGFRGVTKMRNLENAVFMRVSGVSQNFEGGVTKVSQNLKTSETQYLCGFKHMSQWHRSNLLL